MNLKLFPLDTQTCHLTIASYGWTAADLEYLWKVGPEYSPKTNPVFPFSILTLSSWPPTFFCQEGLNLLGMRIVRSEVGGMKFIFGELDKMCHIDKTI